MIINCRKVARMNAEVFAILVLLAGFIRFANAQAAPAPPTITNEVVTISNPCPHGCGGGGPIQVTYTIYFHDTTANALTHCLVDGTYYEDTLYDANDGVMSITTDGGYYDGVCWAEVGTGPDSSTISLPL